MVCRLVPSDGDPEEAEDFGDCRGALLRERPRQVFKVAVTHVIKHFDLFAIDGLEDVLVVERLEEGGGRLAARVVRPDLRAEHRVQELVVGAAVELAQGLEVLRAVDFDAEVDLFVEDVVHLVVGLLVSERHHGAL